MIEYLPLILTGIGLIVAVIYYTLTLRNATKTRQTQMFMQLYNTRIEERNADRFWRVMRLEWKDFDDYVEKYSIKADTTENAPRDLSAELAYYDGLGILLRKNMVDWDIMYELMGLRSIMLWFKVETIVKGMREAVGFMASGHDLAMNFEYLANEMIEMKKEKGVVLPVYWLHPTSSLHLTLNP